MYIHTILQNILTLCYFEIEKNLIYFNVTNKNHYNEAKR